MIAAALSATRRAVSGIRREPLVCGLTTVAMALGLTLVGLVTWVGDNLERWSHRWEHGVDLIVYLDGEVGPERAGDIARALDDVPAVSAAEPIPPERAMQRLRRELGDDLLDGIDATALPPSIEVSLDRGVRDVALAHPVARRLLATEGVADVEMVGEWVDDLTATATGMRRVGGGIAVIAAIVCVFLVFLSLRLRAERERERAGVLRVVGGDRLIRAPLILEGCLLGIGAAALAVLATMAVAGVGGGALAELAGALFGDARVEGLARSRMIALAGMGVAAGFIGAALATGRRALA